MIDEQLLHEIADDVIADGRFGHVTESEIEAATAFAKSDWAAEPGAIGVDVDAIMRNPQMWLGYGILIGLEAARVRPGVA